jgi:glycosyltransferase involved in cell wall biosynthesis
MRKGLATLLKGYVSKKQHQLTVMQQTVAHIVCTSQWQRNQLLANGYPERQLSVIRQALQTNLLKPFDYSQKVADKLRVGYLGRFVPEKGAALLLELLGKFIQYKEFEFVLGIPANSDPLELRKLQQLVGAATVSVKIFHHINSGNKAEFFREIDVLLISSFCMETGPIVLLEAVYFEKLVLAPNIGGPLEFAGEYPGLVHLYQWNNADDAERALREIKTKSLESTSDYRDMLLQKESQFIGAHMDLYFKIINQV